MLAGSYFGTFAGTGEARGKNSHCAVFAIFFVGVGGDFRICLGILLAECFFYWFNKKFFAARGETEWVWCSIS